MTGNASPRVNDATRIADTPTDAAKYPPLQGTSSTSALPKEVLYLSKEGSHVQRSLPADAASER